jgi:hypothetical protein
MSTSGCNSPTTPIPASTAGLVDAEQRRHLTDDDRQGEPDDEALQHRLRDERGQEAHPN